MIDAIIKSLIKEARDAARIDLELERVERLASIKLTAARGAARAEVKSLSRKMKAVKAAAHYRKTGKWVGGPVVPAKIKSLIRGAADMRLIMLSKMLVKSPVWGDEVWQ